MSDHAVLVAYLRSQADYCAAHGSPMYGVLGHHLADDVEAGGPTADLLARWIGPDVTVAGVARDVPALRLLGGLHRLVLAREAPALAFFYPSVGGTADLGVAWPVVRDTLVEHSAALRAGLAKAPQTNEIGRSGPLLGGLQHLARWSGGRPVRLYEIGTSAGLNLRADLLPVGPGRLVDTPMPLPDAPGYEVVERIGGDPHPVDPTTTDGRLTLTSYVWADDAHRLERLRAALAVAADEPAQLLRIGAADLVESIELRPGMVTVLWHSIMWQYVDAAERERVLAAIGRLASQATPDARFAHLRFEPRTHDVHAGPGSHWHHEVRLSAWPADATDAIDALDGAGGTAEGRLLGTAPAHGVPVDWAGAP